MITDLWNINAKPDISFEKKERRIITIFFSLFNNIARYQLFLLDSILIIDNNILIFKQLFYLSQHLQHLLWNEEWCITDWKKVTQQCLERLGKYSFVCHAFFEKVKVDFIMEYWPYFEC